MPPDSPLAKIIRSEIQESGPIPFRRFMELALYHPEHGYYASGKNRVGREGDFITNVSVGPFFGRLLAHYFAGFWEELGRPQRFDLIEIGANQGQLFADVLEAIGDLEPQLIGALECTIVEPFPKLREVQRQTISQLPATSYQLLFKWVSNLQEIPDRSVEGVIWSNELFDALPVHRVKKFPHGWAEMHVIHGEGKFGWSVDTPTYDPNDLPPGFPAVADVPENYTTEIWPHAAFWAGELARVLARGKILTVDYGLEAKDLYAPHRTQGTLQAYLRHKRSPDLLDHVGEQDITAHVNFTALIEAGKSAGLELESFSTQERFLMEILKSMTTEDFAKMTASEKKQFNMLVHPDILGHVFKVLVQSKGP